VVAKSNHAHAIKPTRDRPTRCSEHRLARPWPRRSSSSRTDQPLTPKAPGSDGEDSPRRHGRSVSPQLPKGAVKQGRPVSDDEGHAGLLQLLSFRGGSCCRTIQDFKAPVLTEFGSPLEEVEWGIAMRRHAHGQLGDVIGGAAYLGSSSQNRPSCGWGEIDVMKAPTSVGDERPTAVRVEFFHAPHDI
jgi:hypothetical protein